MPRAKCDAALSGVAGVVTNQRQKNISASVRNRLLALSRKRGEDFQQIITRYGLERFLYRISQSHHRDRFILKGAMLFAVWEDQPHRPTRDVDFLGFGDSTQEALQAVFRDICNTPVVDDGLVFASESVRTASIREATEYGGMRVTLSADLAGARIPIQADIGFGDTVTPDPELIRYPTLLDHPAPQLRAYPRESVVAEKYQALVNLGMANSRMKDFYDLWALSSHFDFSGPVLSRAIQRTFARRDTVLPEQTPSGLSQIFYSDKQKNLQWKAFLRKSLLASLSAAPTLEETCRLLESFLMPPTKALTRGQSFTGHWPEGGPWIF